MAKKVLREDNDLHDKAKLDDQDYSIESYIQLIKLISEKAMLSGKDWIEELNKIDFVDDNQTTYNNLPMYVGYKYLPTIDDGNILVKIVILKQGEKTVLIMPQDVSSIHVDLEENPEKMKEYNMSFSLSGEVDGFDSRDHQLKELIKKEYVSSADFGEVFKYVEAPIEEPKEEPKEEPVTTDVDAGPTTFADVEEMEGPSTFDEIEDNMESYNSFKKESDHLETLLENLYNNSNKVTRGNIRKLYLNESKSVLVIEVNNKNVYDKLMIAPNLAKTTLTRLGESIRTNKDTQLLDSFSRNGKRYFVLAENNNSNFWFSKDDELQDASDKMEVIAPSEEHIIMLNRTSIRLENRAVKPYLLGDKLVFSKKLTK